MTTIYGPQETSTWSGGRNAQGYWLDIGDSPGGNDIFQSGPLTTNTLSAMVSGLPANGEQIYGTLWTEIAGQWYYNSYQWTSAPSQGRHPGQNQLPMLQKQQPKR